MSHGIRFFPIFDSFALEHLRAQTIERRHRAPCGLNHSALIINTRPKRITQFVVASVLKMFQTDYRRCVGTERIPLSCSFVFTSNYFLLYDEMQVFSPDPGPSVARNISKNQQEQAARQCCRFACELIHGGSAENPFVILILDKWFSRNWQISFCSLSRSLPHAKHMFRRVYGSFSIWANDFIATCYPVSLITAQVKRGTGSVWVFEKKWRFLLGIYLVFDRRQFVRLLRSIYLQCLLRFAFFISQKICHFGSFFRLV